MFRRPYIREGFRSLISLIAIAIVCLSLMANSSQAQTETTPERSPQGFPVTLQDQTLFYIEARVGSFPPSFRARTISERIEAFARDVEQEPDSLRIVVNELADTVDITAGDEVLMTIADVDAEAANATERAMAQDYVDIIQAAVEEYRRSYSLQSILLGLIYTLILTVVLVLSFAFSNQLVAFCSRKLKTWQGDRIRGLRLFGTEIIPADRVADSFIELLRIARLALFLGLLLIYTSLVLSFFPWTKRLSQDIFGYFRRAALTLGQNLIGYLPNLFFIFFIIIFTAYTLRLIKFTFAEIRRGTITIPGFYPEWARPTYNIVRFAIIAFAATIAFPYLPGSDTPAFQGISVFLGILFSLGSSGAVANFVAGIILTYSRAFVVGDRVKISETIGDVVEKTLLVTRVNTPKNVVVTIPNSMVLGSHIVNYSGSVRYENTPALVLHTTITLGYDVPWPKVHKVMIEAARRTENILTEPEPFVLQTSLDDFYVSYELNAYTDKPAKMPRTYSGLHQNLQDVLNEAEIEILSPHYSAVRDGHQLAVPEKYFPKGYTVPGFRVSPVDPASETNGDKTNSAQSHHPSE
ncbi:mechanosensitive ion channel family protein [Oscillatoria sp. CS-180]|uniref:mechanosensitive ion channel family protein n=1 Tax=Oscillatoria sp. CS-180 TaxID=3021720 RepID=UPI002331517D|nr:mechanosensitive ion channel family protein [Oscillatoria sp. CS-180]MDB9528579.1 mechanosensitive ion channel family protein [Oscillatoria sp. CS-180]